MSFDFTTNGFSQNPYGSAAPIPNQAMGYQNQPMYGNNVIQNYQPQKQIEPAPKIIMEGSAVKFTTAEKLVPLSEDPVQEKKKRTSKKTAEVEGALIKADEGPVSGTVEASTPTVYSYYGTTELLHNTLNQIDILNSELMEEFESVKNNRALKNKYNAMIGLSENIGSLISNKINVIKEINSTITKSNDLDYKKAKDMKAALANVDDDKYIADLYKSFISSPQNQNMMMPNIPSIDTTMFGSGIVRADAHPSNNGGSNMDIGYLNYMSNLSPEQNLMMMENNPNIKECLVFDASNGNRFFQFMDTSTGQPIPNMPTTDAMFLEDTEINRNTGLATNRNLKTTYPLIVINEDKIASQY